MRRRIRYRLPIIAPMLIMVTALFSFPPAASAQVSDQQIIANNATLLKKYEDWFFNETPGRSTAGDYYDQKNIPQGIYPYLNVWFGQLLQYDCRSGQCSGKIADDKNVSGDTFLQMSDGWNQECLKAGNLIRGTGGKGFLPLANELNTFAAGDKVSDDLKRKARDLSSEALAEARKAITTPSCLNALANVYMAFDKHDYECAAEKVRNPNSPVKSGAWDGNVTVMTAHNFGALPSSGGSPETNELGCDEHSASSIRWFNVPDCTATTCQTSVRVAPDANDFYQWENGTHSEVAAFRNYYNQALQKLNELYKQKDGLGIKQQEDITSASERAQAELNKGSVVGLSLPLSDISIPALIGRTISQLLSIVGALGLAGFIYGGAVYMTAGGNAERADKGRKVIVWSVLGLVVIFTAYAIVSFITTALTR